MREVVIVLYNIRSLHNVGSIFRTADAADVKKIYLVGITPQPIDQLGKFREPFLKVSLGAEKTIPWEVVTFSKLIRHLRKEGYVICAVEQARDSVDYRKFPKKIKKIALVLGSEVRGLPRTVLKSTDYVLEIPMCGEKESLNVSVAAGIVLFELND